MSYLDVARMQQNMARPRRLGMLTEQRRCHDTASDIISPRRRSIQSPLVKLFRPRDRQYGARQCRERHLITGLPRPIELLHTVARLEHRRDVDYRHLRCDMLLSFRCYFRRAGPYHQPSFYSPRSLFTPLPLTISPVKRCRGRRSRSLLSPT